MIELNFYLLLWIMFISYGIVGMVCEILEPILVELLDD